MSQRSRTRRRLARKNPPTEHEWMWLIAAILAMVVIGYFVLQAYQSHRQVDPHTFCPLESKETDSVTTMMVDMTDQMTTVQKKDFQNQLEILRAGIPRWSRLEIYAVGSVTGSLLKPTVSLCNPGRGQEIDPFTGNPAQVEKKWVAGFRQPLDVAFSNLVNIGDARSSPVLESIQSVALTSFQTPDRVRLSRRLIIVSDLLQFTKGVNFYKEIPDPEAFIQSPAFQSIRTNLTGVDIELWILQRNDPHWVSRRRDLVLFWEAILTAQGANLTRVYNISG